MDPFCYLCFVFVMLSCLFIAGLWSPDWKGLNPWLSFVWCFLMLLSLFYVVCPESGVVLYCINSRSLARKF